MLETIKSYLVSLGFAVDKNSYNEASKAMNEAEHTVSKFAGGAATKFAAAGVAVAAFAIGAVVGIGKFISSLGEAQIKNEMLARQMWTTQENAMAFNNTLKALGANLQDLYLSPTLAQQFMELRKQAFTLAPPSDYKNQMQLVQSVTFEFKRMKLEASYALQWIGYYLTKYLAGPVAEIKQALSGANDKIAKDMPVWTQKVAQFLSWFAQFGITVVRGIRDLGRAVDDIGQSIPKNVKLIGGALAALGLVLMSGPIGMIIAGFTLLILLLNDFYTYLDGGKSLLGPFWQKLIDWYNQFKGKIDDFKGQFSQAIKDIGTKVDELKQKVNDFWTTLNNNGSISDFEQGLSNHIAILIDEFKGLKYWVDSTYEKLQNSGVLKDLYNDVINLVTAFTQMYEAVSGDIKELLGMKETQDFLKWLGSFLSDVVVAAFKEVDGLLKQITSAMKVITDLAKGDFKGALKDFGDYLKNGGLSPIPGNPTAGIPNYLFPQTNTQNNTNTKVTQNNNLTNNIYGSDPKSTANQVQTIYQQTVYRGLAGVIR